MAVSIVRSTFSFSCTSFYTLPRFLSNSKQPNRTLLVESALVSFTVYYLLAINSSLQLTTTERIKPLLVHHKKARRFNLSLIHPFRDFFCNVLKDEDRLIALKFNREHGTLTKFETFKTGNQRQPEKQLNILPLRFYINSFFLDGRDRIFISTVHPFMLNLSSSFLVVVQLYTLFTIVTQ